MQYLILVNPEKCTGCRSCELACSLYQEKECNPEKSRIKAVKSIKEGLIFSVPVVCQQCEDAPCAKFCPAKALSRNTETDAVEVDQDKCISCNFCVMVCPFGGIRVDAEKGYSVKCELCKGDPQCVKFCATDAIQYVRSDKIDIAKKREGIQKYLEE